MRFSDLTQFLVLAAMWGGSFLFMRIAAPVLGPVWLIEFRVLLAGLVLLPISLRLGLLPELQRHWKPLFIVGCIGSAIPYSLFAFASVSLPAGFTSILNATAPLFGTAIAIIWLQEKLSIARIVGFLIGFVGVIILVGWKTVAATPAFFTAVFAGLLAALMYAIITPYIKQQLARASALTVATGTQLSAAVFLLPAMPFATPDRAVTFPVIFAVISLAVLSSALAHLLYFRLICNIGSTKALTVAYLIPLFAMLWGAIFLKEAITLSMLLGCILVLVGTAIANNLLASDSGSNS